MRLLQVAIIGIQNSSIDKCRIADLLYAVTGMNVPKKMKLRSYFGDLCQELLRTIIDVIPYPQEDS